jgi:hypothetical protein
MLLSEQEKKLINKVLAESGYSQKKRDFLFGVIKRGILEISHFKDRLFTFLNISGRIYQVDVGEVSGRTLLDRLEILLPDFSLKKLTLAQKTELQSSYLMVVNHELVHLEDFLDCLYRRRLSIDVNLFKNDFYKGVVCPEQQGPRATGCFNMSVVEVNRAIFTFFKDRIQPGNMVTFNGMMNAFLDLKKIMLKGDPLTSVQIKALKQLTGLIKPVAPGLHFYSYVDQNNYVFKEKVDKAGAAVLNPRVYPEVICTEMFSVSNTETGDQTRWVRKTTHDLYAVSQIEGLSVPKNSDLDRLMNGPWSKFWHSLKNKPEFRGAVDSLFILQDRFLVQCLEIFPDKKCQEQMYRCINSFLYDCLSQFMQCQDQKVFEFNKDSSKNFGFLFDTEKNAISSEFGIHRYDLLKVIKLLQVLASNDDGGICLEEQCVNHKNNRYALVESKDAIVSQETMVVGYEKMLMSMLCSFSYGFGSGITSTAAADFAAKRQYNTQQCVFVTSVIYTSLLAALQYYITEAEERSAWQFIEPMLWLGLQTALEQIRSIPGTVRFAISSGCSFFRAVGIGGIKDAALNTAAGFVSSAAGLFTGSWLGRKIFGNIATPEQIRHSKPCSSTRAEISATGVLH